MKDSNMENLYTKDELLKYKDNPEWFRIALLRACTRGIDGRISHIDFMEKD